jgi:hypothetical protein
MCEVVVVQPGLEGVGVGKVRCFGRIAEEWGDGGDEEEEEGKVKMRIGDVVLLQSELFSKGFVF